MTWLQKGWLWSFTLLMLLAQPVLVVYLLWRARRQPAYLRGWAQRFLAQVPIGHKGLAQTRRIWVHAVSVGETHAISPLVKRWAEKYPDDVWMISSTTPTGRDAAMQQFGHLKGVQFFYLPYDLPWLMRRCIKRVNADQLWIVETELWPNLLAESFKSGLFTALINARVSPRTGRRLKKLRGLSEPGIGRINAVICQTAADAEVFQSLGRPVDAVSGNLKFDVPVHPSLVTLGQRWRDSLGASSVLILASSRDGEEEKFLEAMERSQFFKRLPKVSVWIVPRHPQRCEEVYELMRISSARLGVGTPKRRSQFAEGEPVSFANLFLGDSMGEMPAYYSLADVAMLGGSWEPFGGQNLIEACAHGCPVWMGPNTWNFAKAADDACLAGAAVQFEDFPQAVAYFLDLDGRVAADFSQQAKQFSLSHAGATEQTLAVLEKRR
ncbi:MAG: 3-deoxy-D-manno-octulosonic acid transferase [Limnobacter sp.]|nr:3-deoxy-D-manno-octulosonic acid transferase [Limnobacter sp.]